MTDTLLFPEEEQSVPERISFSSQELVFIAEQALRNFMSYNQNIGLAGTGRPMSETELRAVSWTDAVLMSLKMKGVCGNVVVSREVVDLEPDAEH